MLEKWKTMEHESDGYTNCNWYTWYSHERIDSRTGGLGKKRAGGDHPNCTIVEVVQNTEESPGDLRWLSDSSGRLSAICYIIVEGFFFILSFFVGYILSFGLVRLRTNRFSARAGAHIECRCSRSCAEDVTITDVIIKTPDRKWDWGCEWHHARKW